MKFRVAWTFFASLMCACLLSPLALADTLNLFQQGTSLPNAPDYAWYYGCSPTAAGMMMGFYDRNGYGGYTYNNLVPGGVAEGSTWTGSGSPLADSIIASPGYIHDFYSDRQNRGVYPTNQPLPAGDDVQTPFHSFNSLGDFMGTSQDSAKNPNGVTTFYYYDDGKRLTAQELLAKGLWGSDGMFGMSEYFNYAGYTSNLTSFFTQPIYGTNTPYGFTFADYMAEIDAGRVMMIQLSGHSMFGYGYGADNTIEFYDTWSADPHTMVWGGSYAGMQQWGVTGFIPSGGEAPVPEPGTFILLGSGCIGLVLLKKVRA